MNDLLEIYVIQLNSKPILISVCDKTFQPNFMSYQTYCWVQMHTIYDLTVRQKWTIFMNEWNFNLNEHFFGHPVGSERQTQRVSKWTNILIFRMNFMKILLISRKIFIYLIVDLLNSRAMITT
jgi:hypothetical protein